MNTSDTQIKESFAESLRIDDNALTVALSDGRTIAVPLTWYPRLLHGNAAERANWQLVGNGEGIHWPELDEDISVAGLLAGHTSTENSASLSRWLERRQR
jgi:Protein of unknown function (DUF2442)